MSDAKVTPHPCEASPDESGDGSTPMVTEYDANGDLRAIHFYFDDDYIPTLHAARAGKTPPQGGRYVVWLDIVDGGA